MAAPAIIWRNPKVVQRRRLFNQARRDTNYCLYIVVRSASEKEEEWEGLPNLEVLVGGAATPTNRSASRSTQSRA